MNPTPNNQDDELDSILFETIESVGSYTHRVDAEEADYIQSEARADILAWHNKQLEQAVIKAKRVSMDRVHKILMSYGRVCEDDGYLSERAVTIRMELATYFNDAQLKSIDQLSKSKDE